MLLRTIVLPFLLAVLSSSPFAIASPEQQVDSICAAYALPGSPGCVVGVAKNGKLVFAKGYGLADLENDVPMTAHTMLDIGSNTKQFTATCILLLEEQGRLSLDDELQKYIPEFPVYEWPITLQNLMQHTSGIRDYFDLMTVKGLNIGNNYPADFYLRLISSQSQLNFRPGDQHLYSNSGYLLLAEVVHRVTGTRLAQFAQENILDKLGMKEALFYDDPTRIVKHRAESYGPYPDGNYWRGPSIATNIGDGGILSTVGDLALWDENSYSNKLGKGDPNLMRKLETQTVLNGGDTLQWALGLRHDHHAGHHVIRHGGAYYGFRSEIARFPEQHFTVFVLANLATIDATGLAYQVADLFLSPVSEPQAATPINTARLTRSQLEEKAGVFRNPITGTIWTVTPGDSVMNVATSTGFSFQLTPVDSNHFRPTGIAMSGILTYTKLPSEETMIELSIPGQQTARFQPFRIDPAPQNLDQYVGEFHCRDLELTFVLTLEGDVLSYFDKADSNLVPLSTTIRDEFVAQDGQTQIRFERDSRNQVHALRLSLPRAKNILFERTAS